MKRKCSTEVTAKVSAMPVIVTEHSPIGYQKFVDWRLAFAYDDSSSPPPNSLKESSCLCFVGSVCPCLSSCFSVQSFQHQPRRRPFSPRTLAAAASMKDLLSRLTQQATFMLPG